MNETRLIFAGQNEKLTSMNKTHATKVDPCTRSPILEQVHSQWTFHPINQTNGDILQYVC